MSSQQEIFSEIDSAFSEFVDEVEDVRNHLLKFAKEHSYQIRKTRDAFNEYLKGEGADGDMLKNMTDTGIRLLKEQITPNKSTLFPRSATAADEAAEANEAAAEVDEVADEETVSPKKGLTAKATTTEKPKAKAKPKAKEAPEVKAPEVKAKAPEVKAKAKSVEVSPKTSPTKTTNAKKAKDGPKRVYGFNLYSASIRDDLIKQFPDNPTARSKEAGERWNAFQKSNPTEAKEFNDEAARQTEESGYVAPPSKKKSKEPSEKRPIQARQAFHSDQYSKYSNIYRKANKLKAGDTVPPKEVMRLTAEAWSSLSDEDKEKYQTIADEQNEREGRHHKEKSKKSGDELKPTSAYRLFCTEYREKYETEHENESYFSMADKMNAEWNRIKNEKGDMFEEWNEKAKTENDRRSKLREQLQDANESTVAV